MWGSSWLTRSDCKDCGHKIYHPPASHLSDKFENVHVKVMYDYHTKHYITIIKGSPEKIFCSCSRTIEQVASDKEIGRILKWANGDENEQ